MLVHFPLAHLEQGLSWSYWIELYNNERPHDSLNDMTPIEYRKAA
ncbi:integrase core domain-containing protein [Aliidiomarina taiwanensis]